MNGTTQPCYCTVAFQHFHPIDHKPLYSKHGKILSHNYSTTCNDISIYCKHCVFLHTRTRHIRIHSVIHMSALAVGKLCNQPDAPSRLPMWYNTLLQLDCGVFKHPMSLALPVLLSGWFLKNVSLTLKPIAARSPHCNSGQLYVNTA